MVHGQGSAVGGQTSTYHVRESRNRKQNGIYKYKTVEASNEAGRSNSESLINFEKS